MINASYEIILTPDSCVVRRLIQDRRTSLLFAYIDGYYIGESYFKLNSELIAGSNSLGDPSVLDPTTLYNDEVYFNTCEEGSIEGFKYFHYEVAERMALL